MQGTGGTKSSIRGISPAKGEIDTSAASAAPRFRVDESPTPRSGPVVAADAAHALAAQNHLQAWRSLLERLQEPGAHGRMQAFGAQIAQLVSERRQFQTDAALQGELKSVDALCAQAFWSAMMKALPQETKERLTLARANQDDAAQFERLWGQDVRLTRWAAGRLPQGDDGPTALNLLVSCCTKRHFPGSQPFHGLACGIAAKMAHRPGGERVAYQIVVNLIGAYALHAPIMDIHPQGRTLKAEALDRLAHCASLIGDATLRHSAVARLCEMVRGKPLDVDLAVRMCRSLAQAGIGDTGCRMLLSALLKHPAWHEARVPQPDDEAIIRNAAVFAFLTDPRGEAIAPDSNEPFEYPKCLVPPLTALLAHGPAEGRIAGQVVIHTNLLRPHAELVEQYAADKWDLLLSVLR